MSDYRMYQQAIKTMQKNAVSDGNTINPFNETVDNSGICPTITTRPDGFKTAILVVEESNCVDCDECEHRSEDCLCDISENDEECPLIKKYKWR